MTDDTAPNPLALDQPDPGTRAVPDVRSILLAADESADPALLPGKYAAMRATPFAFLRGACHLFYSTLPRVPELDEAPHIWLAGDLHAENFGTYKGDNRLTYFDVNDFDATVLGPFTLDAIRLLASVLVGAGEWGLTPEEADGAVQRMVVAYATELSIGKPAWVERETARGAIKRLFAQAAGRSRTELLDRFTVRKGKRRRLAVDGERLRPVGEAEAATVQAVVAAMAGAARDAEYFRLIDLARRVAGIGSMAHPRYVVLVEGRGSPDRNVLLEVKAARPSPAMLRAPTPQPAWESDADRIVAVQRHSTVVAPAFLSAARTSDRSFLLRELQPADDRLHLRDWERQPRKLIEAMVMLASLAAWMHLRGCAWRSSATVDAVARFAAAREWRQRLLEAAREAATRTLAQYETFRAAYDRGAFVLPEERAG